MITPKNILKKHKKISHTLSEVVNKNYNKSEYFGGGLIFWVGMGLYRYLVEVNISLDFQILDCYNRKLWCNRT